LKLPDPFHSHWVEINRQYYRLSGKEIELLFPFTKCGKAKIEKALFIEVSFVRDLIVLPVSPFG